MYGLWWNFPVPDIERTDLLVIMGANPAASQGSLLAAPNVMGLIDAIRKRGKVIVIDPVRTPTAARADEWLPIVPGTDAALLLAVAHTLFAEDLARPLRTSPATSMGWTRCGGPSRTGHRNVSAPSPASAKTGSAGWPANSPAPTNRWSTDESGCATRNSAASPAGSSTWSTS